MINRYKLISINLELLYLFLVLDPTFQIEHVLFKKPPPEFDIRLKVDNPNKHKTIFYDEDSHVTLSFKQKEIADGKFLIFDQDARNSTILPIALQGSSKLLPQEIVTSKNSTQSKIGIPLSLSLDLGLKVKIGALNVKNKRIQVSCSFMVGRLENDTHIWDQDCGMK
ncbi:hypothetical protein ACH5RR_026817 [Cinchona calisaya]|uniref:Late embryogenesis abundant protein LEA-2 subgroup domain-containing protein n=1 Tax=Cinchona calisaya TaxID=153742 RepID=A0ABD2Z3N9_9GENT